MNDFMHTLAWSLLHFLWQGAAIAALAAALMYAFRTPATRYLIGVGSTGLMFVSFGLTIAVLGSSAVAPAATTAVTVPILAATVPAAPAMAVMEQVSALSSNDALAWVARIWLAGVGLLALRVAFGVLFLERLRRRHLGPLPDSLLRRCLSLQARLGISRVVRYCECKLVAVPAVIGLFRPIVLLPVRALTGLTPLQLEAVIAHELGHIKRFDVAVNFLQVVAETLFFFHPAVWWLNRRIRADREDCCDDVAIAAGGEKAGYARALATMEGWRDLPTFAMAATGGPVAARVARLLGVADRAANTRSAGMVTATLVLGIALLAGAVSLGVARTADAAEARSTEPAPSAENTMVAAVEPPAPVDPPSPVAVPTPVERAVPTAPAARAAPGPREVPAPAARPAPAAKPAAAEPAPRAAPAPAARPADRAKAASTGSYIAEMKQAGFDTADIDTLVALKIHDVTPAYVKTIRGLGYDVDADGIVAMKIHGITPEYVTGLRDLGFTPDADELIGMKVHGITPDYVRQMRKQGFDVGADELIALKVHDVTPEYRDALAAAGYTLKPDQVIQARVLGITPEFINAVRSHGFKDLSMEKLILLKNADIL